ncbi:retrovirus-related pol polyprotein from transposon RE1, partial [Tanacetum coccineum]
YDLKEELIEEEPLEEPNEEEGKVREAISKNAAWLGPHLMEKNFGKRTRKVRAHKLAPRSIPCVFIGYNPQYKGYKCLDPDSSRIYITRHARFDEVTFPFASPANPNALSTLQLCTFLEDGPPISDAPVPESRPTDTRPSSSSPCGLCPLPTTAAEPIHEPDSTPSSPYSSEDDNPPTDSDDVSSHGAPPATAPIEPSSVHQMKTRSKSGIFKTKHSSDFVSLTLLIDEILFTTKD